MPYLLDIIICSLCDGPPFLGQPQLQLVKVLELIVKETDTMLAP